MNLNYFNNQNLSKSIPDFFASLSIPFSTIAEYPLLKKVFFQDTNHDTKYLKDIEFIHLPILINEKFNSSELFEEIIQIEKIQPDYAGIFIFGIEIKSREKLISMSDMASITRAFSREIKNNPVVVFFLRDGKLSIANCERTPYIRDRQGEKPGKVSVLKDIDVENPHAGHLRILEDLNIANRNIHTFRELNAYWLSVFDTSILNKKFYKDISNWYFLALKKVSFPFELPNEVKELKKDLLPITLIRFLTRLIFVWFLKEKKLIPEALFDEKILNELIIGFSGKGKKTFFYTSILQNLFFGTLNTYRNGDNENDKSLSRKFRAKERDAKKQSDEYLVTNLYRYESNFKDKDQLLELLKDIPFLNGGLFECLDKRETRAEKETRIDCFSDIEKKQPNFPDYLFFADGIEIDLSDEYQDKKRNSEKVNGIIRILNKYKFTIEENTPLEEEVALDPELLGKVFENLLASFNPETSTTARKQTGSFYTPREIVNYMVEESLIAYYKNSLLEEGIGHTVLTNKQNVMFSEAAADKRGQLELTAKLDNNEWKSKEDELEKNLRNLLDSAIATNLFSEIDTKKLIQATANAKILDPACGSGAFPMGVLHKMVDVLRKLDPENQRWKQEQLKRNELEKIETEKRIEADIETAKKINSEDVKKNAIAELEEKKKNIEINFNEHEADYARKLYLIENCIYGVDIQPIAVQITKLRFFISLIIDQKINPKQKNLGIIPLPNLETKFVAANTLVGLEKSEGFDLKPKGVDELMHKLQAVRQKHFYSRSRKEKLTLITEDKNIRDNISKLFKSYNKVRGEQIASWDPYNQNSSASWFDPQYMFEIENGFDVVIGNPPYVQLQKDGGALAKQYEKQGYETFTRMGDLYSLFYEKGFYLLNNKGNLCFITSNKWMRAEYGKYTRKFFAEKTKPLLLIDFGQHQVFENATVDTNILLVSRSPVGNGHACSLQGTRIDSDFKTGNSIRDYVELKKVHLENLSEESWVIGDYGQMQIKKRVEEQGKKLKDWDIQVYRGVLTGYNEAFIIDKQTKDELIKKDKKNAKILKPILRGRDIQKWVPEFADLWIIGTFPSLNININEYPEIKKHLLSFGKKRLEQSGEPDARKKTGNDWFETQDQINYWKDFEKPKIIFPNMSKFLPFIYDENKMYSNQKGYIITGKYLKYLTAFLNSFLFKFCFSNNFPELQGGTRELSKVFFEQIPVKAPTPEQEENFITLVDKILESKAAMNRASTVATADTSIWEAEIDARVFHLYGLTEEEMLTVLNSFPKMSIVEKTEIQNFYRDLK